MKSPSMQIVLVFACLACLPTPAVAATSPVRHLSGTIQKVDTQVRELEIRPDDKGPDLTFVWGRLTTFVANGQIADAAILKRGSRVEVRYHRPFFGKPSLTKVTLLPR